MTAAIRFDNLEKTYGRGRSARRALNGISFEVHKGEIFGFLGPNGAGKTTAIHCLMNFLLPTSGSTEIFGIDALNPQSREAVGFLPEIFNFDGFLTGNSFLKLFGQLSSRHREDVALHIPELLNFLDMPDAGEVKIRNYSKGMTQKIGLAQALIGDPDLLVLDEPTSGMDPVAKAKIKQLFIKLRSEGKTIFLSSHILSDVEDIADRVAIINNGELLAVDKISELQSGKVDSCRITYSGGDDQLISTIKERARIETSDQLVEVHCSDRESKHFVLRNLLDANADILTVKQTGAGLQSHFLRLLQQEELVDD